MIFVVFLAMIFVAISPAQIAHLCHFLLRSTSGTFLVFSWPARKNTCAPVMAVRFGIIFSYPGFLILFQQRTNFYRETQRRDFA